MPLHLSVDISDAFDVVVSRETDGGDPVERTEPFPRGGTDLLILNISGAMRTGNQRQRFEFPSCVATVRRSDPFRFRSDARVRLPAQVQTAPPGNADDNDELRRDDFGAAPASLFVPGTEHVWFEVVDLDARGTIEGSAGRLLLGATLLAEHPDLHERALGVLASAVNSGFPARLAVTLHAMIVSPRGTFQLGPEAIVTAEVKALTRATGVRIAGRANLFRVEDLRRHRDGACEPAGQLTSLDVGRTGSTLDGYQAFAALKQRLQR